MLNASNSSQPDGLYAGFWIRSAALFIDQLIVFIGGLTVFLGALFACARYWAVSLPELGNPTAEHLSQGMILFLTGLYFFVIFIAPWIYFAAFEAGTKQATPGKRLFGLRVVNASGERISFARATGRYFAKIISSIPFNIGFLIAAFTTHKQALHDFICDTYVVSGNLEPIEPPASPPNRAFDSEPGYPWNNQDPWDFDRPEQPPTPPSKQI